MNHDGPTTRLDFVESVGVNVPMDFGVSTSRVVLIERENIRVSHGSQCSNNPDGSSSPFLYVRLLYREINSIYESYSQMMVHVRHFGGNWRCISDHARGTWPFVEHIKSTESVMS